MTISDRMEWHEIVSETMKLLQGLKDQEKEMAVAAIAAGCNMTAKKTSTGKSGGYSPAYRNKKPYG